MASQQTVSIILPLYNSKRFLQTTLDSVLAQTYPHWELVVVDDGSPDDSVDIVRALDDRRIRIFERENTGPCRARNFAIAKASGTLIGFIDHDDIWHPTKLEKHIEHLDRRPEVGVSYGPSEMIDLEGEPIGLLQLPKLTDVDAREILCRCPVGNGSVPLIRREVLEQVKFYATVDGREEPMYFDEEAKGWEDVELWFRIAMKTPWIFEGIPDCLTKYRIVPGGVAGDPEKKQRAFERGIERCRRYAPEFIAEHEGAARAYHLRYLARRLIQAGDGPGARAYMHRALKSFPGMFAEEFGRTSSSLGAAYLLSALPKPLFDRAKALAVNVTRARQDLKIKQ